jgi:hypothetical protein
VNQFSQSQHDPDSSGRLCGGSLGFVLIALAKHHRIRDQEIIDELDAATKSGRMQQHYMRGKFEFG